MAVVAYPVVHAIGYVHRAAGADCHAAGEANTAALRPKAAALRDVHAIVVNLDAVIVVARHLHIGLPIHRDTTGEVETRFLRYEGLAW